MKSIILSITLAAAALISCNDSSNATQKTGDSKAKALHQRDSTVVAVNNNYNDIALFLAGYMPQKDSALIKLTKDSVWVKHAKKMNDGFARIEENRFSKMRTWRDTELKAANSSVIKTLYYPFSGPDILNGYIMFPNCENYILIALEPAGKIKDMPKMKQTDFAKYLYHLDKSMNDIFVRSYFITSAMSGAFSKWSVDGNLPVMMVFLARTQNTITNIKRIAIADDGSVKEFNLNDAIPDTYISKGVRIDFVNKDQPSIAKHVYYYSMNMADEEYQHMYGLDKNKGFLTWIDKQGDFISYMKAASYINHYGFLSNSRKIVFARSKYHLQDDSGIGYSFFDKKVWKFNLYGAYSRPIRDFKGLYEKDLDLAYKKDSTNVKPVPFKLGYHYSSVMNMMLATKK